MAAQRAFIVSDVLRQLRTRSRLAAADVAKSAGVQAHVYEAWEAGAQYPTIAQLRAVAKKLRYPIAVFYLSAPPSDFALPKDYRVAFGSSMTLTAALVGAVRQAVERRETALSFLETLHEAPRAFPVRNVMRTKAEEVAARIRSALGVAPSDQDKWDSPEEALDHWRRSSERANVLVFQASKLPASVRAFSLANEPLPVIVLNRRDAVVARSFSLAHELAHIALNASGICDPFNEDRAMSQNATLEAFCNHVAGAILIPANELRAAKLTSTPSDAELSAVARRFKTSAEVVVRRLTVLGVVDEAFYRRKREQYEEARKTRRPKKGGPVPVPKDVLSRVGRGYAQLVLRAKREGVIGPADVAAQLGAKLRHISAIEAALRL